MSIFKNLNASSQRSLFLHLSESRLTLTPLQQPLVSEWENIGRKNNIRQVAACRVGCKKGSYRIHIYPIPYNRRLGTVYPNMFKFACAWFQTDQDM